MLAMLGLQPASESADLDLLKALFGWMAATRAPWPQVFFDWFCGAPSEGRAGASPIAALYQAPAFDPVRAALMSHRPERPERLAHEYFAGAAPASLLIEEVEALWAAIAEADDWGPFDKHMQNMDMARMALDVINVKHA
jgi:hypothetical protein